MYRLIILLCFFICKTTISSGQESVRVKRIERIANYYVIYAFGAENRYMIISKKAPMKSDCERLRKGKEYKLVLKPIETFAGSEVECFQFDEKSTICRDADYMMVSTKELVGCCLIE
jgi:hypothetical protein